MNVETRQVDGGTEVRVSADRKVAVAVKTPEGERIYLPEAEGSDSSYYVEEPESLRKTSDGYAVVHPGEVEEVEVIR
ncbi:MAG: hypothetical protein ABEJ07_00230 [Candidatus Nanohaloarchaea archaeon]